MTWLVIIVLALLIPEILSTVLDSRLGRAAAVRLESGAVEREDQVTAERLRYLENEVDRLASEVHRLNEESEFLHQLLAERGRDASPRIRPGDPDS